jgi:hypothetical protein
MGGEALWAMQFKRPLGGADLQACCGDPGGCLPPSIERALPEGLGFDDRDLEGEPRGQTAVTAIARSVMTLRTRVLIVMMAAITTACGSSPSVLPSPTAEGVPQAISSATPPPAGGGDPVPVPGGFDITRVRLMDAADLPASIPVPVPFGGEIDESLGAFEGNLLAVEYDPRFFQTAAAFYATWIQMEGLEASPLMSFSENAAGWEVIVDGAPVRVEISISPDGSKTLLAIYWD